MIYLTFFEVTKAIQDGAPTSGDFWHDISNMTLAGLASDVLDQSSHIDYHVLNIATRQVVDMLNKYQSFMMTEV